MFVTTSVPELLSLPLVSEQHKAFINNSGDTCTIPTESVGGVTLTERIENVREYVFNGVNIQIKFTHASVYKSDHLDFWLKVPTDETSETFEKAEFFTKIYKFLFEVCDSLQKDSDRPLLPLFATGTTKREYQANQIKQIVNDFQ